MFTRARCRTFLQLMFFIGLVLNENSARANPSCQSVFSNRDVGVNAQPSTGYSQKPGTLSWSRLYKIVTALSHETSIDNLVRILIQGQLSPRGGPDSYQQPPDGRAEGLGGFSDSVYLDSFKRNLQGTKLYSPTIFFSPVLLRRMDYFVTLKRAHGHYRPNDLSISGLKLSFNPRDWTEENAEALSFFKSEIVFSRSVSIGDFAAGIWVPTSDRQAFLDLLGTSGIDIDLVGLPIYFSDVYPSLAEVSRTLKEKGIIFLEQDNGDLHPRIGN